jgi:ribonuclease Z
VTRELVVLGTSSMVPTRTRAHVGAVLRWDDELVLLDPGEGTQRQLTLAGVPAARITRICITHLHGDHCLGLPGVLQRMAVDGVTRPVHLYYPASGEEQIERLRRATLAQDPLDVRLHPVGHDGPVDTWPSLVLHAHALDHRVDTYGWRLVEPDGRRMLADRLAEAGIAGADVRRLLDAGHLDVGGRRVSVEEVSEPRRGQVFGWVMDTRPCAGALEVARDADLLVTESTYLSGEEELAEQHGHLTAAQAGRIAAEAGARRLVLLHYSQRHPDEQEFADDARRRFTEVHAARDLERIRV